MLASTPWAVAYLTWQKGHSLKIQINIIGQGDKDPILYYSDRVPCADEWIVVNNQYFKVDRVVHFSEPKGGVGAIIRVKKPEIMR